MARAITDVLIWSETYGNGLPVILIKRLPLYGEVPGMMIEITAFAPPASGTARATGSSTPGFVALGLFEILPFYPLLVLEVERILG